jgi:23S rRNA (uracil1939-C5)-methyltransferase
MQHEVIIEKLSHDGRGIAHIDGKICFVSHALPGERVQIAIQSSKRNFSEATTVSVLSQGETRVEPRCGHFTVCGGCSLQHVTQDEQIQLKQSVLLEQFTHFGQITPKTVLSPLRSDPYHYRRKARIGVKYVIKKDRVFIGFRERNGRYLTDCTTCEVIHPRMSVLWEPLREVIAALSVKDQIPQVECAIGDEDLALVFRHLQPLTDEDRAQLMAFAKTHQVDLYLQPKGPSTVHLIYPEGKKERVRYALPAFNLMLEAHPLDFMQVNAEINQQMIARAIELLDLQPTDTVLDLFCGLGNFTLPLSRYAAQVTGVEGEASMVARVLENAALNGCTNVEAYCADLSADCSTQPWAKKSYTKLLIDPARAGAQEILGLINQFNPERLCYVSCNPATLARDAGLLREAGYSLEAAGIMDMFTHTHHTEAMALFVRG